MYNEGFLDTEQGDNAYNMFSQADEWDENAESGSYEGDEQGPSNTSDADAMSTSDVDATMSTSDADDDEYTHRSSPVNGTDTSGPILLESEILPGEQDMDADGVFWQIRQRGGNKTVSVRCKTCPVCGKVIDLGEGMSMYAVDAHIGGRACKKLAKQTEDTKKHELADKKQLRLTDMFAKQAGDHALGTASHASLSPAPDSPRSSLLGAEVVDLTMPGDNPRASHVDLAIFDDNPCPGVVLVWSGSIWTKYPWHLHQFKNLSYVFVGINESGSTFRIRSKNCTCIPRALREACTMCGNLHDGAELRELRQRSAQTVPKSTNYRFYTFDQLCDLLAKKVEQQNEMKLKALNMDRKISTLSTRLSDHKRIVTAIAMSDLPSVARLVAVALRSNWGPKEILSRIERACKSLYHVKSFNKKNFEVAKMVLTLGGPKLLYAIHKSLDLPNVNSVYQHAPSPKVLPSLAKPTALEIGQNMDVLAQAGFFWRSESGTPPPKRGWSIMVDNIALDERPCYDAGRNTVVGMCREHSACCDLEVTSIDTLRVVQGALETGDIHRAKEATVAGVAPFASTNYSMAPVMISGTCKQETAIEQRTMFMALLDAWYKAQPDGSFAIRYGDIWSVATDGDATYRAALHFLLMSRILEASSPIYRYLAPLRLMNFHCGDRDIIADKDLKHKVKNFAGHLRAPDGFLVLNTHIQPALLRSMFAKDLKMDGSTISVLFDLRDHQNVSKAVRLLVSLAQLSALDSMCERNPALYVLGQLLGSLVHPYIHPSMSLSEQLTSLSTCAHLLFKLWRTNGSSFCPGQLYYDIQSLIKNIYWDVAKQKVLAQEVGLYIGQRGSDRLENEFGNYRTMTHQQNVDIQQLADRAGASADLSRIFADNPEWDRGHRRLRLEGSAGVDHTNPASWTGDVIVGNVSLLTTWNAGRREAIEILSKAGMIDAARAFDINAGVENNMIDMLRPEGHYVGLRVDSDGNVNTTTVDLDIPMDDGSDATIPPVTAAKPTSDSEIDTVMLEDFIPEEIGEDPDAVFTKDRMWLDIDGSQVHKASAVRLLLGADEGLKSTERLLRVRGYTRGGVKGSVNNDDVAGDLFMIGQMVATFLRCDDKAALAILRITAIVKDGDKTLTAIPSAELANPKITLRGQVLSLKAHGNGHWHWTGTWEAFEGTVTKKGAGKNVVPQPGTKLSKKVLLVDVPAFLTRLVNPPLTETSPVTPDFETSVLEALTECLWLDIAPHAKAIPTRPASTGFPYRRHDGSFAFVNSEAAQVIERLPNQGEMECFVCDDLVQLSKMRDHVAAHLLAVRFGFEDARAKASLSKDVQYCGFCGRLGTCTVTLKTSRKTLIPVALDCPRYYKFSMKAAAKTTKSGPSTNRPIQCPLCIPQPGSGFDSSQIIWTYNLELHVKDKHPHASEDEVTHVLDKCQISPQELIHLGLTHGSKGKGRACASQANTKRARSSGCEAESSATMGPSGSKRAKASL